MTRAVNSSVGSEPLCRSCAARGLLVFLSLGALPLPDALLRRDQLSSHEPTFPLDVAFCPRCSLVQLVGDVPPEKMFVDNYLYFSSFSDHLLEHSARHAKELISRRDLGADDLVVEIASNDGYLLRNFVEAGVPVLGIDPSPGPAAAARELGIPTLEEFFGIEVAKRLVEDGKKADVIIANNVMAHVPDLTSFVGGMAHLIAHDGVIVVENPSITKLIEQVAFDTIYHEHTCYYSCTSVQNLVQLHGLHLNHVEEFPELHGGTLRWHISRSPGRSHALESHLTWEQELGVSRLAYYTGFGEQVRTTASEIRELLRNLRDQGRSIAAYGAAAKGTVLLNYVGIDADLIDFVVDRNHHKHRLYMPGVHIPIRPVSALLDQQPDYTLLLAWNFAGEIMRQQQEYIDQGGRFIHPIPQPEVLP